MHSIYKEQVSKPSLADCLAKKLKVRNLYVLHEMW